MVRIVVGGGYAAPIRGRGAPRCIGGNKKGTTGDKMDEIETLGKMNSNQRWHRVSALGLCFGALAAPALAQTTDQPSARAVVASCSQTRPIVGALSARAR